MEGEGGGYRGGVVEHVEGEWMMIWRGVVEDMVYYSPPYQNESEKNTHSHTCPCDDWSEDGSKLGDAAVGPADESSHYKNKGRKVQLLPGFNTHARTHTHTHTHTP